MKYAELDFERKVIRIYRPLEINPTSYLKYGIYKLTLKRLSLFIKSDMFRVKIKTRDIQIVWL